MENNILPTDPAMLLSYVNTKLRDNYKQGLDAFCSDMNINREDLEATLRSAGFEYSEQYNKFW
jgi:Ca2+-binding EF-hand superfamily protein